MSKYTPGPWELRHPKTADGKICEWYLVVKKESDGIDTAIASVDKPNANAHLIATAPDLLEFIRGAATWFARYGDQGHYEKCLELIAKAEGK